MILLQRRVEFGFGFGGRRKNMRQFVEVSLYLLVGVHGLMHFAKQDQALGAARAEEMFREKHPVLPDFQPHGDAALQPA